MTREAGGSWGFTLVEILVVLLLIAMITGSLTLSIDTKKRRTSVETSRFASLVDLAADEAIMKSEEIGVLFRPSGYLFLRFQDRKWQPFDPGDIFRERQLPAGVTQEITIGGESLDLQHPAENDPDQLELIPQLTLSASGDFPYFSVIFKDTASDYSCTVTGDPFQGIRIDNKGPSS